MKPALLGIAVVLFGACAEDTAGADAAAVEDAASQGGPAAGDWFTCANDACTELLPTGLRLDADLSVHHLIAATPAEPFVEGDPYCVDEAFGSYTYRSGVLTLTLHQGGLMVETELEIDDSGLVAHDGDMHKVRENATGRWVDDECVRP